MADIHFVYCHEGSVTFSYPKPSSKMTGAWVTSKTILPFTILTTGEIKTACEELTVSRNGTDYTLTAACEWYTWTPLILR